MKSPLLSIIIVSYNSEQDLEPCLRSVLAETAGIDHEVFLVDNASSDHSVALAKKIYPQVQVIENRENLGFARANNLALSVSKGRYLMLLNPDTELLPGVIKSLISYLDGNPRAGAAGCKLLNSDGSLQFSIRNFPNLANQFSEAVFLHHLFKSSPFFTEVIRDEREYRYSHKVDWVSGALLVIKGETLKEVGYLDESFFMYSEEKDWCYRARLAGWDVMYFSDAMALHKHGDSGENPDSFEVLNKSRAMFLEKFNGRWKVALFRAFSVMGHLIRIALCLPQMLFPGRARKAAAKIRLHWRGI